MKQAIKYRYRLNLVSLWFGLLFLLMLTPISTQSQVLDTTALNGNKLVAFPLIFYLPETSLGFGGAGAYTFHWKNQSKMANPSQVQFALTYTLENQVLVYAPYKLYLGDNDYFIFGEGGYFKYFYRYYGIGPTTSEKDEETYRTNFPRFTLNATKQIFPNWFVGPSIWFDQFNMKEFDPDGELTTGTIGDKGGNVLGLGLRLIHDTRDNTFYPTRGFYGDLVWLLQDASWGSDYTFQSFEFNVSKYIPFSDHQALALNLTGKTTGVNTPFYHLALHGGPRSGRGYIEGRFRDRFMSTFNAEWRQKIKGRFGAVLFTNIGGVSTKIDELFTSNLRPAIGLGLRFELDKINHLNLRLDYGIGKNSSEFYITVGEAF